MKKTLAPEIERGRAPNGGIPNDGPFGAFKLTHPDTGRALYVIASDGRYEAATRRPPDDPIFRWEHVSVSVGGVTPNVCPTWAEMCWVKDQFWEPSEWVVQFHPAAADHVNVHPGVLHLWRPKVDALPVPPKETV